MNEIERKELVFYFHKHMLVLDKCSGYILLNQN